MSTLRQPCPSCRRQLELPTSALGRLAQCPACDATFTVTVTTGVGASSEQESSSPATTMSPENRPPDPQQSTMDPSASAGTNIGNQVYGNPPQDPPDRPHVAPPPATGMSPELQEANPFSSPLDDGMAAQSPANPYGRGDYAPDPVAEVGALKMTPRRIDDVFSLTFSIFGDRCGLLILAFLLSLVATFVAIVAPIIVLRIIDEAGGAVGGIGLLLFLPVMLVFASVIWVGLSRNALAVARNAPNPISELMPPMGIVVRFLVGVVLIMILVGILGSIGVGLMSIATSAGNESLVVLATIFFFFGGSVLSIAAYWLLWSWPFIVSDGRLTVLGSIQAAIAITMHNKTTSFLLVVVSMVLSIVGTTVCYVGHLITAPLTMLLLAVAYLMMTNQPVSDPRTTQQGYYQTE